jgi:hypothetical protein
MEGDDLSGHEIILLADTLTWRPVSEIKDETAARKFGEQMERDLPGRIGGPGLDLSGNLLCAD